MNRKYEKYIDYIVNDIQAPYFKNMRDSYGLSPDEYEMILSKIFKQPVSIMGDNHHVYGELERIIYSEYDYESSDGYWQKWEYVGRSKEYFVDSDGYWEKWEYNDQGKLNYYEDSNGRIENYG
jgi:hypothetical protein